MTPREAAAILRQHNEWRRWDEDVPPPIPSYTAKQLGVAIDIAAKYIEDNEHE